MATAYKNARIQYVHGHVSQRFFLYFVLDNIRIKAHWLAPGARRLIAHVATACRAAAIKRDVRLQKPT